MQKLELILILLALAAGLRVIAERCSIPLPAILVLGGLVLAITPGLPRIELEPDTIFFIFIPPLLYWAALTASYRDFRRNLRSISLLGIGLVLATMCVVAWAAHAIIPEMTWGAAFTFGVIVSPPDAVAVTSITRRLGVSRDLITILDGESLLNDATAFVAYRMAVAAVVAGTFSIWHAGLRFLWTGVGGIALGLAVGWLIGLVRRWLGELPVVENTLSLLTPFAAFIPAERLGLASVLSVVATGLYLGRQGPKIVSARTRLQAGAMWEMVVFILEGLIFIIIGLELPLVEPSVTKYPLTTLARYTLWVSAALIVVRIVWVFPGAYLPRFIRRKLGKPDRYPPWQQVFFAGWAGIRGGDSLVIALALPLVTRSGTPFPARDLIIFLTFAVILVTLVLQGLTLPFMIRLLGLRPDGADESEEASARLATARAGLHRLDKVAGNGDEKADGVARHIRQKHEHRIHRLENADSDEANEHAERDEQYAAAYTQLRLEMIAAEREEVIRLRDEDVISDDVMRRIQQELDLEEVRLSSPESGNGPSQADNKDDPPQP